MGSERTYGIRGQFNNSSDYSSLRIDILFSIENNRNTQEHFLFKKRGPHDFMEYFARARDSFLICLVRDL